MSRASVTPLIKVPYIYYQKTQIEFFSMCFFSLYLILGGVVSNSLSYLEPKQKVVVRKRCNLIVKAEQPWI